MFLNDFQNFDFKLSVSQSSTLDNRCCEIFINKHLFNSFLLELLSQNNPVCPDVPELSDEETQLLKFIAEGEDNASIAKRIFLSIHTVKLHINKLFKKLNVKDRTHAVTKALQYGLIDIDEL